jgi:hypothetical protein
MSDLDDSISAVLHEALDCHIAGDGRGPIAEKIRERRRVRMIRNVAVPVVVAAVAVGAMFSFLPTGSSKQQIVVVPADRPTTSVTSTEGLVSVPVDVCPTRYSTAPPQTVPRPRSVKVHIPSALAGRLAMYTDNSDITQVLGPKGWNCVAYYSSDYRGGQTGGLDVYPPGEAAPPAWSWGPQSNWMNEVISIYESGRRPLLAAAQACPYFPAAASYLKSHDGTCWSLPGNETVTRVNGTAVVFEIPPNTKGWTDPNPDNGIATYSPTGSTQPGHYEGNCMLPRNDREICTAVLDYAISLYSAPTRGESGS